MQVSVNLSEEILRWVIEHVQMDTLPSTIVEYLNLWMSGTKSPTFNQIEKVSKATGIPLGYFFLQTPPQEDLSLVSYRTIDSVELENPSRNLIDTMHDMEQIQLWMRDQLISDAATTLQYVGSIKSNGSVATFAKSMRKWLGLNIDWYKKARTVEEAFSIIRTAISNAGTLVMLSGIVGNNTHRALDINEFRAFAMVDEYAPLIFINSNDSVNGKLFSLLHEMAHVFLGESSLFNDRFSTAGKVSRTETLCNAVAAEILVPQQAFVTAWADAIIELDAEQAIEELAHDFKCGITVIARRAYDNHFIEYELYQAIAQRAVQYYNDSRRRKKERGEQGGDFYRTAASRIDRRFFGMLVNSVQAGKTLYSDAFRLTNTNRTTFATLASSVGGGIR